jgi:hypothetical protein
MGTRIGRLEDITTSHEIDYDGRKAQDASAGGRPMERGYVLTGRVTGLNSGIEAGVEKESLRMGAVYCAGTGITSGYYFPRFDLKQPRGAPGRRPWTVDLTGTSAPWITRQAENDGIGYGSGILDDAADEGEYIQRTQTGDATVIVMQPRILAGSEPFNLPAGSYRMVARARASVTITSKLFWRLTDLAGATIVSGSEATVFGTSEWEEVNLGILTVPQANSRANWYEVHWHLSSSTRTLSLDRVRVVPA